MEEEEELKLMYSNKDLSSESDHLDVDSVCLGTASSPQPAVVLTLKRDIATPERLKQLRDALKSLKIFSHSLSSTKPNSNIIFLGLYLSKQNCEVLAESYSFHVPFHVKEEGRDTGVTQLKSMFYYGSVSYNSFTKINYTAPFVRAHRSQFTKDGLEALYSVRTQAEIIYLMLKHNDLLKHRVCKHFGISSDFIPHTPELANLTDKISLFPGHFPLREFCEYFGEEITYVYAWNNLWLLFALFPIALVSMVSIIYGIVTIPPDVFSIGVKSELLLKLDHVFMNDGNKWFALFLIIWLGVFQYQWKGVSKMLGIQWGMSSFGREEEPFLNVRPRLKIMGCFTVPNLLISLLGFFLSALFTVILFVLVEVVLRYEMEKLDNLGPEKNTIISFICSTIYSVLNIVLGSVILPYICRHLTIFEGHKFQSFFDNSFNLKLTGYYIVSSYVYLIYLSFKLDRIIVDWLDLEDIIPLASTCTYGMCNIQIRSQLILQIFMLRFTFLAKALFGFLRSRFNSRNDAKSGTIGNLASDADYITKNFRSASLGEAHEWSAWMVDRIILYGLVALFSIQLPLVALLTIILEVIVTYLELQALVVAQRPAPRRSAGIPTWEGILFLLNLAAIFTNSFTIVSYQYTSEGLARGRFLTAAIMLILTLLISLIQVQDSVGGDHIQMYKHEQIVMTRQRFKGSSPSLLSVTTAV